MGNPGGMNDFVGVGFNPPNSMKIECKNPGGMTDFVAPGFHFRRSIQYYNKSLRTKDASLRLKPHWDYTGSGLGLVARFDNERIIRKFSNPFPDLSAFLRIFAPNF